jgi:NitT/TauT family transport system ATP-binding protein
MKNAAELKHLYKAYGDKEIFKDLSLSVQQSEIVAIFGPNGCGKSTLMGIMAGTLHADAGETRIDRSELGYVFQNYRESLLPWKSNYENVRFPLELKNLSDVEVVKRIKETESLFEIAFDWNEYPYNLSGGQQQLLAFFRVLVTRPKVILIDEAFSALDFENNLLLRGILQKYYTQEKPTIIMITHSIEEAVHLGHRVIIFPKAPVSGFAQIENLAGHPRTLDYVTTDEFHEVKDSALNLFRKVVKV